MPQIPRRNLIHLLGATLTATLPATVHAQSRRGTLVLGLDISDTITLDPARMAQYTPPMTLNAAYDSLVTFDAGNYVDIKPSLAESWTRSPDGRSLRFKLRPAKFASGAPVTAEDVKWTLERVQNLKDQPALYISAIARIEVLDPSTLEITLTEANEPILGQLASTTNGIMERRAVEAQGGLAGVAAKSDDKATAWLDGHSAGAGAYVLTGWQRNVQIQLTRNPHHWRGLPGFERILIRHMSESAAQLLAVQRGDLDAAFNLIPEQIATLRPDPRLRVQRETSLDFVYLGLTQNPELNKYLAIKEARQAIGYAIDFEGIRTALLGGNATRPPGFFPVGMRGSTEQLTREIGYNQDLDRARALLRKAGLAEGFDFEVSYGNAAVSGLSYGLLAQKLQSDLARVGIRLKLNPMDQVNLRTQYTTGRSQAVITFWNPAGVEQYFWATSSIERVAKRLGWEPPADLAQLVRRATLEPDEARQTALWIEYQRRMIDVANLHVLFQPVYQVAVRDSVGTLPLTASGPQVELHRAAP